MESERKQGTGFFSLILHAHQPYVLHHGTWPHGLEWLLEAASETYLPLLSMAQRLLRDGIRLNANVSLSPVLLEQLASPDFREELQRYLQRKIASAREDAAFFDQAGELHLLYLARHWEQVFERTLQEFNALDNDIVAGFRQAEANGALHLLTSAATHGYAPLLGTDESLRGQFQTAVATHRHHLGKQPRGAWLPECGYRPAGPWQFPVQPASEDRGAPQDRAGVERALAEAGLRFTFVDSHLIEDAEPVDENMSGANGQASPLQGDARPDLMRSLYHPHTIAASNVAVFARDPRSAFQVWSARFGYPGDFAYLDFHKKRWPGGHRYWRVTEADTGMTDKQPYHPEKAAEQSMTHARHFVAMLGETLRTQVELTDQPPVLCAPFDLELFGHWWHEGMHFLEDVARVLAENPANVEPIACGEYLERFGTAGAIRMHEGSWGAGGDSSVWLNAETGPLLSRTYAAELAVGVASQHPRWTDGAGGERIAKQMCRELLLMEASDWPTLITTGAARDYAERRFEEHAQAFASLLDLWDRFSRGEVVNEQLVTTLVPLETHDDIFPEIRPVHWRALPGQ